MLYDLLTRRADFIPGDLWTLFYALWILGSTVFLLLRRQRPQTTLAWLLAFWTMPLIAALIYFLVGPRRLDEESGRRYAARRQVAEFVGEPASELPSSFLDNVPFAELARVPRAGGDVEPAPSRCVAFALFEDGETAYPAMLDAIAEAGETVHLEYYIWQPDGAGSLFRDALVTCASRGVQVRIVVDALGAKNCKQAFWQPLLDVGATIRRFNPPHPFKPQPGKINFRTHRKIVIVDSRIAFTGGININDHELNTDDGPAWRNTHLRVEGRPAADLQSIFLEDWLYGVPLEQGAGPRSGQPDLRMPDDLERWFPNIDESVGPWVQFVDSGPDEPTNDIHLLYFAAITSARRRVLLSTPYFVPDEPIITALGCAAARGVEVSILVPERGDSHMVNAAAETFARDIAESGAKLFLYQPRMTHSKTLVVDDDFSIVGTANIDNRSFRLNFEVVAAVFDRDVNAELARMFHSDLEHAKRFDASQDDRSMLWRMYTNAIRLLAPLL